MWFEPFKKSGDYGRVVKKGTSPSLVTSGERASVSKVLEADAGKIAPMAWSIGGRRQHCGLQGTNHHRLYCCPGWKGIRLKMPSELAAVEQQARRDKTNRMCER